MSLHLMEYRANPSLHTGRALDSAMTAAAVECPQSVLTAVPVPDAKTVPRVGLVYRVLYVHVYVFLGGGGRMFWGSCVWH